MMSKTQTFLERFSEEARKPEAAPERLALYIAGMAYPDLNVDAEIHILNRIAERMAQALSDAPPGKQRAFRFLSVINHEFEFDGNRADYYDVRNSYLNDVLERRVGLPLSLSMICMAVGRRLRAKGFNITVDGLGLPSHFMARYEDEAGVWFMDPFNGTIILPQEASGYLARMLNDPWDGTEIALPPEVFRPVSANMVAFRMLHNLRIVFLHEENLLSALRVLDYMLVLAPNDALLWRERGLLHYQCEVWDRAERDLRRYFFLNGNFIVTLSGHDFDIILDEEADEEFSPGFGTGFGTSSGRDLTDELDLSGEVDSEEDTFDDYNEDPSDSDIDGFDLYTQALENLSDEDHNLLYILSDIEQIRSRLN